METGNMRGREISLIDLLVEILLHWRSIIAVMVIGGILLGGAGYVRSARAVENQLSAESSQEKLTREDFEQRLSSEELMAVDAAYAYQKLYEQYSECANCFGKEDFAIYETRLTYWISAKESEPAFSYNLATVYRNLFLGEDSSIEELNMLSLGTVMAVQEENSNVLQIVVRDWDEDGCNQLTADVLAYMQQEYSRLKGVLGKHEVTLLSQKTGMAAEESIRNIQKSYLDKLNSLKNTRDALLKNFTEVQNSFYAYLCDANEEQDASEQAENAVTVPAASGLNLKYFLLGMVLFGFLEVFALFLMYVLNDKLRSTDSLQELYGMSQLGRVEITKRKRFLGFVDCWILKLRYRGTRRFSREEALELAAVAVKITAAKADIKSLYLIGCNLQEETLEVCRQIKAVLEKEGITADILNNVLYDAEAMEKLSAVQSVVLVETAGSTMYTEITAEIELLTRQNIKVLGGVVVG